MQGEFWRLFTGNLAHADINHWLINILGLWILWIIYTTDSFRSFDKLVAIIFSSIGTCLCLLIFEPHLRWYVGLSGALHGLLAAGIIVSIKVEPKYQVMLGTLLVSKLFYEQMLGPMPGTQNSISVPVIVNSHLYGAICGLIIGVIITAHKKVSDRNS